MKDEVIDVVWKMRSFSEKVHGERGYMVTWMRRMLSKKVRKNRDIYG